MSRTHRNISQLPKFQKPREKLLSLGVDNLSNAELLAIILGSGTKKINVLNLSKKILKTINLKKLRSTSIKQLKEIHGIGAIKACTILACCELAQRLASPETFTKVITPKDVLREVNGLWHKSQEHMVVLFLNARHQLLKKQTVAIGSLNYAQLEPRDVFSPALKLPCAFLILVHNHPSGDVHPSKDDRRVTERLIDAGDLLGIEILDHLIVSKNDYFSFREDRE